MYTKSYTYDLFGIDHGTSNTTIVKWEAQSNCLQPFLTSSNDKVYHSTLDFSNLDSQKKTNSIVFGKSLKTIENKEKFIAEAKRFIDLDYYDATSSGYDDKIYSLYEVEEDGKCCFKIEMMNDEDCILKPHEAIAIQLRFLKEIIEKYLINPPFKRTIIAYPPSFSEQQKQLLKYAYTLAGYTVVQMIPEPEAALKYFEYLHRNEKYEMPKITIVIDIGGGTTDLCICERQRNGEYNVHSACGNPSFGGKDIDEIMMDLILDLFENEGYSKNNFICHKNDNLKTQKKHLERMKYLKIKSEIIKKQLSKDNTVIYCYLNY